MIELTLPEIKQVQLNVLRKVHEFCVSHEIQYSLGFGTMLGAVRHKGFIPWDDDIDIIMPRTHYQKFIKEFAANDDPAFAVRSLETDPKYEHPFAKVEDLNTKLEEFADGAYDIGINIDVFPLDGVPTDEHEFEKFYKSLKFYRDAWVVKTIKSDYRKRGMLKSLMLSVLKVFASVVSRRRLAEIIQSKVTHNRYEDCEHVMVTCVQENKRKHKAMKEWFEDVGETVFEGQMFKAVTHFDEYLTVQYGDYMKLPPEKDRVTHHNYKAYRLTESGVIS